MKRAATLALALAVVARAEVRVTQLEPVAAVGGVLVVPLEISDERWPTSVRFEPDDGSPPIDATVAWVGPAQPGVERSWTMSDERIEVREAANVPSDADVRDAGVAVAAVRLPPRRAGAFRVAGARVSPRWLPLAETEPDAKRPAMPMSPPPVADQPDPVAPMEWFRWWLMAEAIDARPPEPSGSPVERLLALHRAQLWRAGLERVERTSAGVARELQSRLTAVCSERRGGAVRAVAAWIARADELGALLGILLDDTRTDEQVMEAALSWVRARPPVTVWIDGDDGRSVRLVALNPGDEEAVIRMEWVDAPGMPPLPLRVPARGVGRQTMERPPALMPDLATAQSAPQAGELLLQWKDWSQRLSVPPSVVMPRPPGLSMGLLLPPLSLADAQRGRIMPPPAAFATTASVRRSQGAWEVFVECLRPELQELDELEILLGTEGGSLGRVRMGEHGEPVLAGFAVTPQVRRGSFRDRWRAVVRMPEGWPGALRERPACMVVGVARAPGGAGTRQIAGPAVPPWTPMPTMLLDPAGWWSVGDPLPTVDR
jgi:hypothetical protein